MKIKFVLPYSGDPRSLLTNYDFLAQTFFARGRRDVPNRMPFMSLAFPILSALTPPEHDIEILDESVEPIDFDAPVDLVGLTAMTYMAPHAYRVAHEFKKRGVYVVLGGVHASLAVDEALRHVDTVFVGEAENTWRSFLDDFRQGRPGRVYRDPGVVEFNELVLPRWDLVKNKYYLPYFIQASRGCCFNCDFCQIHLTFGKKIRYKPVDHVLAEIRQLHQYYGREFWGGGPIIFSDDNIIASPAAAEKLFRALVPLKLKWCALASANVARREKLLDLMVESGCDHLFIGFESVSQKSMDLVNKGQVNKVDDYRETIDILHSKGINVSSLMMYGMDGDGPSIFRDTVDFVETTALDFPIFHTILPLPGTVFCQKMKEEDRILTYDWTTYTGSYSCIKPLHLTPEQLEQGNTWSTRAVYEEEALLRRLNRLYEKGALRGDKPYWGMRAGLTVLFALLSLFKPRPLARFIRKIIRLMWSKKNVKISPLLLAIDHFAHAQTLPEVAEPLTATDTPAPWPPRDVEEPTARVSEAGSELLAAR